MARSGRKLAPEWRKMKGLPGQPVAGFRVDVAIEAEKGFFRQLKSGSREILRGIVSGREGAVGMRGTAAGG